MKILKIYPYFVRRLILSINGIILRINKFLEISLSTAFQARAVTGRLLCLQRLENAVQVPLYYNTPTRVLGSNRECMARTTCMYRYEQVKYTC